MEIHPAAENIVHAVTNGWPGTVTREVRHQLESATFRDTKINPSPTHTKKREENSWLQTTMSVAYY